MVIFCTNSKTPLTFRTPNEKDMLGSGARKMYLLPKHEVEADTFAEMDGEGGEDVGLLYANGTEKFRKWQQSSALGHWGVMRTVLPRDIWEDW